MIQHSWINNAHFNGLYTGTDPISHFPDGEGITIQGRPANLRVDRAKPFVTVRGGAYFFLPGLLCAISPPRHDLKQCCV
jgi:hypothetical protein